METCWKTVAECNWGGNLKGRISPQIRQKQYQSHIKVTVIQNIQNLDNSQVKQLAESLGLAEAHLTFFIFFHGLCWKFCWRLRGDDAMKSASPLTGKSKLKLEKENMPSRHLEWSAPIPGEKPSFGMVRQPFYTSPSKTTVILRLRPECCCVVIVTVSDAGACNARDEEDCDGDDSDDKQWCWKKDKRSNRW